MPESSELDTIPNALPQEKPYRTQAKVAWILMAIVAVIALIPMLGFASWFIASPLMLVAFIMIVIVFTKGGIGHGLALLGCQLLVMPIVIFFGPIVSSALGIVGVAAGAGTTIYASSPSAVHTSTYSPTVPRSTYSPTVPRSTYIPPSQTIPEIPVEAPHPKLPLELDSLKTKMLGQQSRVLAWVNAGDAVETDSGFLKAHDSLDIESRKLLQQENLWREQAFARIAEMTGTTPEEVAKSFKRLAVQK